jgi:hypothetical protein
LLAASAAVPDTGEVDRAAVLTAARAAANRIAERGGAQLGDKTLLDALLPSIDALASHDGNDDSGVANALAAMVAAAPARAASRWAWAARTYRPDQIVGGAHVNSVLNDRTIADAGIKRSRLSRSTTPGREVSRPTLPAVLDLRAIDCVRLRRNRS